MNNHDVIPVPYLVEAVAFLLTVVLLVPILRRLNISPILGYLGVGALIGPYSLGLVTDVTGVRHFAELGVVFLLFAIGLELSFERLRAFTRLIFGLGTAQVVITAAAIGAIAYGWGNSPQASAIIGLCLALSSTAMVMQLLNERGEMATRHGRGAFAVLLFQDLAVVPILILVSVFGAEGGGNVWQSIAVALGRGLLAVIAIVVVGRYLFRYLFRVVARTANVDVFTAMTLLAILATSMLTGLAGLSLALGAFLAGLLLAETEFRHQIESEIDPFKGLLLGLFFMSVGMSVDLAVAAEKIFWVSASVFGLIAMKTAITFCLALAFNLPRVDALRTGLLLGEAGEFAFVVIGQATISYQLIPNDVAQFMVLVAGLSMALTPLLAYLGGVIGRRSTTAAEEREHSEQDHHEDLSQHVILVGYGRVGRTVAAVLRNEAIPYVALDKNQREVQHYRQHGEPIFFGNAADRDMLARAGADRARVVLITLDDTEAAAQCVRTARRRWPELAIVVRARDAAHADQLSQLGADAVIPETLESSLQMSASVLREWGMLEESVAACLRTIRDHHYAALKSNGPAR